MDRRLLTCSRTTHGLLNSLWTLNRRLTGHKDVLNVFWDYTGFRMFKAKALLLFYFLLNPTNRELILV